MTDETCTELAKLVNITHLDLRYCPLTNAGMARASQAMPRLEYCKVEGCRLTCLGIAALLQRHRNMRVWGPGEPSPLGLGCQATNLICLSVRDARHTYCVTCQDFIADSELPQLRERSSLSAVFI